MLTSLAIIFIVGLAMAAIVQKLHIPRIIGMLITGIVTGPYVLDMLDPSMLSISSELRSMALIIILIKAGLSLDITELKKVGRPSLLMSFLPACFEIVGVAFTAPLFLGTTLKESLIMGAVLGAVSPAVVVPRMVRLIEEKRGTDKSIPQIILAGASLDDVFVIVLFSAFVGMEQGKAASVMSFFNIPISIVTGILAGACVGFCLSKFFETNYAHKNTVRNSLKTIIVLGFAFLLYALETWLEGHIALSGLLAVMSMACVLKMTSTECVTKRLSQKFGKLWLAAEVILFVLVGATVDIRYTFFAGLGALAVIFISLIFRSVGVLICLAGTKLDFKEKLFCVIAYLPKATVQAAIGSVPLTLGLKCGNIVLSVAVVSIIFTAPIGAFLMDITDKKLLNQEK